MILLQGYEVKRIGDELYLISEENVCIYVVCGKEYAAVIDTGYGSGDLRKYVSCITKLPQIVILTHGHPDHFLGAYYYEEAYIDPRDIEVFDKYNTTEFMKSYAEYNDAASLLVKAGVPKLVPIKKSFDLGGRTLEVVDLHGHTPGSVGLLLKEDRILFSGDGLTFCVWLQLEESTSVQEYLNMLYSIKQREKDFDLIYNGHSAEPYPASYINNVIALTEEVINDQPGNYVEQDGFSGFCAQGDGCQMIYRKDHVM